MDRFNKIAAVVLVLASLLISVPLIIKTIQTHGGPWGFGLGGLPVLIPVAIYSAFAVVPFLRDEKRQRGVFQVIQAVTFITGSFLILFFPFYPIIIVVLPLLLLVGSIFDSARYKTYLLICMILAIAINLLFLTWEFDYGRTIPLFQLFQSSGIKAEPMIRS